MPFLLFGSMAIIGILKAFLLKRGNEADSTTKLFIYKTVQ